MIRLLKTLALCAIAAAMLVAGLYSIVLGIDYITIGYGLNPWLAFPTAALEFFCLGYGIWFYCADHQWPEPPLEYINLLERKLP